MEKTEHIERYSPKPEEGLTKAEVNLRKEQGLLNVVEQKITKTTGEIIRENVCTLFNLFNVLIAIALAFVGAYSNLFFMAIIILNVTIGIIQELQAKKLVEDLSIISSLQVQVIREKEAIEIPVEELVLDDVVMLDLGKQICADSIVIDGQIEVNEALLTGESDPIIKNVGDSLLSGSFVVSGKCHAKIEAVGADNFASKLALEAKKHKGIQSELLSSMKKVTKFTSFFIVPIGIILFVQAYFLRSDLLPDAVVATAAALLGMLPKGLALLISIALATGVIKLSKKRILVQDLYSVETLAHVDVLCLDKTGTITEGKMSVSDVYTLDSSKENSPISLEKALEYFVGNMDDNNATFQSLSEHFQKDISCTVLEKTPFSSSRKWSSITLEGIGTIVVGAPERLEIKASESLPQEIKQEGEKGKRLLCVGFAKEEIKEGVLPPLHLLGAITLNDAIRKNVRETLDFFKREGVEVKIISGDHPVTVSSIARQAGIEDYDAYIDMSTVDSEADLDDIVTTYRIFGRVSPSQKSQLVHALQNKGHKVAMTGDGVNDVLALKEADCSIAMAAGSDAAKQVAQLVLLDSDFTSLPDVVMEGRRVVNNVTRVASVFFIKTIYSVLLSIYCILAGRAFPFIPIQITLIDLAIEGYPAFFMSFEPVHNRIKGTFLGTAFRKALPFALTIVTMIITMFSIHAKLSIGQDSLVTVMYYLMGFISICGVIRSCLPFNKLRTFLAVTDFVGYFTAVVLFTGLLKLQVITKELFSLLLICGVITLCVLLIYTFLVEKLLPQKTKL